MSNTRDSLSKLTKPQLQVEAQRLGRKGYSAKNKPELIELILNPPTVQKSPGRPKGSGTKPVAGDKTKIVEHSVSGLNDLPLDMLKELARQKDVPGYSNKRKADLINLLMAYPHVADLVIQIKKGDSTITATIRPTDISRSIPRPVGALTSPKTSGAVKSANPVIMDQIAQPNMQAALAQPSQRVDLSQSLRLSPRSSQLAQPQLQASLQPRISPRLTAGTLSGSLRQ